VLLKIQTFWDFIHCWSAASTDGSQDRIASIFRVKLSKKRRKTRLELPTPEDSTGILRHIDNYQSSRTWTPEAWLFLL